jgi:hypothetical protein
VHGHHIRVALDHDHLAGQKAALRAFQEDQRFMAQTFVAVEPNGMDPCEHDLDVLSAECGAAGGHGRGHPGQVHGHHIRVALDHRLIFPIRGIGGEIIGFGARKLYDDDQGPKYLNTALELIVRVASLAQVIQELGPALRGVADAVVGGVPASAAG